MFTYAKAGATSRFPEMSTAGTKAVSATLILKANEDRQRMPPRYWDSSSSANELAGAFEAMTREQVGGIFIGRVQ
jgi:hypothetical protein